MTSTGATSTGARGRQVVDAGRWRWIFDPARRLVARVPRGTAPDLALFGLVWERYERAELKAGGRELVVSFDTQGRRRFRVLMD